MMEVPYHYQFRIIVIGDTMVGKSSLLKTFSDGTFGEMEPTVGVDFFSKIIEIKPKNNPTARNNSTSTANQTNRLDDENIIVKLQIWDTAGQERFKSIVTSYYRNSVGIVLVYDVTNRESYDHLIDWFTEARKHVEPTPSPTLSPITQNPPHRFPLTSTPNASPAKKKLATNNVTTTYNNTNHQQQASSSDNSSFNSSIGSNRNCTNNIADTSANLSFDTALNESRFDRAQQQQSRQGQQNECFKMAYLVLGCKTDLEKQRQVSYEDGQAFANHYGFKFIETSSKTHYNVNTAFQLLAEEIYDKISECGRLNRLHRTASGGHLTFVDGNSTLINEGIRLGPLIENTSRRFGDGNRVRLLEAQPVSGFLGGCC